MHGERGAAPQARTCLEQAHTIFQRLGARHFTEQAEQALTHLAAV